MNASPKFLQSFHGQTLLWIAFMVVTPLYIVCGLITSPLEWLTLRLWKVGYWIESHFVSL